MHIRTATPTDHVAIRTLYQLVAAQEGGLVRNREEITDAYVQEFITKSISDGIILVAQHPEREQEVIAEIHAYSPGIHTFAHLLSHLTIAVHPDFQGKKIGRTLFTIFQEEIALHHPGVGKVELLTRESNARAIRFYQSLGFRIEGRLEMRVRTPDGSYEADIPMGWQNPNFEF